jgi:uncharacterized protein YjbJ (UPF0337 family)
MDKDRIPGAAKELKGSVKEAIGEAAGDARLESDGKADNLEGKAQNMLGGLKDALKSPLPSVPEAARPRLAMKSRCIIRSPPRQGRVSRAGWARLSALAVFRLIQKFELRGMLDAQPRRGAAPLRILSPSPATRRNNSPRLRVLRC